MTALAARERSGLCDDALAAGPDAPTLCEGWSVRDLLVHLHVRDGRPGVALGGVAGRLVPAAGRRAERVQEELAALPFGELVDRVRSGPPAWSPARAGAVDELVNLAEFFTHREDVRRAQDGWTPRELDAQESRALWRTARTLARVAYHRSGVGVVLVVPDGPRAAVRKGVPAVTLTGQPQELLLHAFGRRSRARVEVGGFPQAVHRFQQAFPAAG
ncbi:TIGR03085 family metal-binding protein [Kineococcus sp. SYSU DK004]|uniref:TIGR03085 family metal-binding protein n=1 Tax=Kineococcus sp. SYSU DK004 TaxID=3383125 RepID=UPI003D7D63AF